MIKYIKITEYDMRQYYHTLLGHGKKLQNLMVMIYCINEVFLQILQVSKIDTKAYADKPIREVLTKFVSSDSNKVSHVPKTAQDRFDVFIQEYVYLVESIRMISLESYHISRKFYNRNIESFRKLKILPITKFPCTLHIRNSSLRMLKLRSSFKDRCIE